MGHQTNYFNIYPFSILYKKIMHIEKKGNTNLLCKKSNGKKITTSFSKTIDSNTIKTLTEKEFLRYIQQTPYKNFSKELFDTTYLETIVKQNLLLTNYNQANISLPPQKNISQKINNFYKEFIFQSNQTE